MKAASVREGEWVSTPRFVADASELCIQREATRYRGHRPHAGNMMTTPSICGID
jgi:hypothetical protein